jgi:aprataxin
MARKAPALVPAGRPSSFVQDRRDGLGEYLTNPGAFPVSRVIYYNDDVVAIHDLYPKSSVHTLLLPRSKAHNYIHPVEAFDDVHFLAMVRREANRLKTLVAKELQRRYGPESRAESERQAVLDGTAELPADSPLPAGRDWEADVMIGIHARPSMNHLHVHVLSRDMYSEWMKKTAHYNSFNTGFFIDLADFPIAHDDPRRRITIRNPIALKCWRCGRDFAGRFSKLKEHLAREFSDWKKE